MFIMPKFIVETSARHVHVTQETLETLFGKGATLTKKKDLSQPGQFACEGRVTVVGPKRELANVSILGPVRKADQIELSATDARSIGVPLLSESQATQQAQALASLLAHVAKLSVLRALSLLKDISI